MKQLIIVRKDLNMSKGKMSAQVSHASIAFILDMIKENSDQCLENKIGFCYYTDLDGKEKEQFYKRNDLCAMAIKARKEGKKEFYYHEENGILVQDNGPIYKDYSIKLNLNENLFKNWINGSQVKIICEAKNKNHLIKALELANELNIKAFPIYDECRTELQPEETNGTCLTCIGFEPKEDETISQISKKYQLFKE